MAKPTPPSDPFPFIAAFCERVLLEKDDAVSIIRIVDSLTLLITPGAAPPFQSEATVVLAFRPGTKKGSHKVAFISHAPDGESKEMVTEEIAFAEGSEPASFHLVMKMIVGFRVEGVYCFEVLVNGKSAITMPLRVAFQWQQPPQETTKLGQAQRAEEMARAPR